MKKFTGSNRLRLLIAAIILSQFISAADRAATHPILKKRLKTATCFEDLFIKVRTITLDPKRTPIGELTSLAVSPNNHFLIYDRTGPELFLFNQQGDLIRSIEVSKDIPGLNWRPQYANVTADGSILVTADGSHHLFLFDSLGQYIRKIPAQFPFQYLDLLMDFDGFIYGYSLLPPEYCLKKLNQKGEIQTQGGIFPVEFKNYFARTSRIGNLMVLDDANNIYQINSCGPEIYKLSRDLKLIQKFDHSSAYYQRLERDLPDFEKNPQQALMEATRLLNTCTQTVAIHLLTAKILMLQYLEFGKKSACYLDFCTTEGEYLTENKIQSTGLIAAALNSRIYKTSQSEPQIDDRSMNPVITEYRIK